LRIPSPATRLEGECPVHGLVKGLRSAQEVIKELTVVREAA